MQTSHKFLNEDITNKVENYLIEALLGIADLYHLYITTDDEKEIFTKQFEELSCFLSTWGLSEKNRTKIKNYPLNNPINNQYEKIVMLKKVRDGKKNRIMLADDVVDNVEYALINSLSELCKLYYRAEENSKQKKLYLQQYGELFVFLSGWGVYYNLDWQDKLPDDVMSEFNTEAYKKYKAFKLKETREIIQKKWQKTNIYALSGFTFKNSDFFQFDIIALNIHQKFISNKPLEMFPHHDNWREVFIQKSLTVEDEKGKVVVGSGSLGSDGFVALVSNNNELLWSIYSEHTGSFIGIEYKDNEIIVESSKGYCYLISLDNPLTLKQLANKIPCEYRKSSEKSVVFKKEAIMKKIQKMWDWGKVYALSGLLFKNGEFSPFDTISLDISEKFIYKKEIRISSLSIQWSKIFIEKDLILDNDIGKIVVGSGTHTSDGFIAYISSRDELIWSIFFKYTGAFSHVEHRCNDIVVKSIYGYNYSIPIESPLEISVLSQPFKQTSS